MTAWRNYHLRDRIRHAFGQPPYASYAQWEATRMTRNRDHDVHVTFTIRDGEITRVRETGEPDMTETVLTDPQLIRDAVDRVTNAAPGRRS